MAIIVDERRLFAVRNVSSTFGKANDSFGERRLLAEFAL